MSLLTEEENEAVSMKDAQGHGTSGSEDTGRRRPSAPHGAPLHRTRAVRTEQTTGDTALGPGWTMSGLLRPSSPGFHRQVMLWGF